MPSAAPDGISKACSLGLRHGHSSTPLWCKRVSRLRCAGEIRTDLQAVKDIDEVVECGLLALFVIAVGRTKWDEVMRPLIPTWQNAMFWKAAANDLRDSATQRR